MLLSDLILKGHSGALWRRDERVPREEEGRPVGRLLLNAGRRLQKLGSE